MPNQNRVLYQESRYYLVLPWSKLQSDSRCRWWRQRGAIFLWLLLCSSFQSTMRESSSIRSILPSIKVFWLDHLAGWSVAANSVHSSRSGRGETRSSKVGRVRPKSLLGCLVRLTIYKWLVVTAATFRQVVCCRSYGNVFAMREQVLLYCWTQTWSCVCGRFVNFCKWLSLSESCCWSTKYVLPDRRWFFDKIAGKSATVAPTGGKPPVGATVIVMVFAVKVIAQWSVVD